MLTEALHGQFESPDHALWIAKASQGASRPATSEAQQLPAGAAPDDPLGTGSRQRIRRLPRRVPPMKSAGPKASAGFPFDDRTTGIQKGTIMARDLTKIRNI